MYLYMHKQYRMELDKVLQKFNTQVCLFISAIIIAGIPTIHRFLSQTWGDSLEGTPSPLLLRDGQWIDLTQSLYQ